MKQRFVLCSLVVLTFLFLAHPSFGAGTKLWNFTDIETWLQGEFNGTGLTSRGDVIPTILTEETDLSARLAWESISVDDGELVATSLPAGVVHVDENGEKINTLSLDQLGVTSFGTVGEQIYAGASPSGTIYEYNRDERSFSEIQTVSDSYIWEMQSDPEGNGLYFATGPDGTLYHMAPDGGTTKIGTVPGHNIMDLAIHDGTLFLGDDRGGLYKLNVTKKRNQPTRRSIESVYGFNRGEVASISSDGTHLYLAVNIRQSGGSKQKQTEQISELAEQLRQQSMQRELRNHMSNQADSPGQPSEINNQPGPRNVSPQNMEDAATRRTMIEAIRESSRGGESNLFQGLSGTLVYRMAPPKTMNIVYNDPNEITHDLKAHNGNLFVATGGKGRLYKVKPDFTRIAYFQSNHKLVLSVRLEDGKPQAITTGEGAGLFRRTAFDKEKIYYRSPPLDAHLLSRWGTLKSITEGPVQFRTRSGNSNNPDTNWASWSRYQNNDRFSIPSNPARFLQFDARFSSKESRLKNVQIAYRIPNQQPQISSFEISPNPHQLPITQPQGGQEASKGNSDQSQFQASRGSGNGQRYVRQLAWKALDPDGDSLESILYYRPIGSDNWITLAEPDELKEPTYTWNISNFSDGWYELRLEVSDRHENPPGEHFTAHQQLGPVLVDNTAPQIRNLTRSGQKISFTARDKTSWILAAQYRVNGEKWKPLHPADGIFDEKEESFEFTVPEQLDENDLVEIRIMDEGGNRTLTRTKNR